MCNDNRVSLQDNVFKTLGILFSVILVFKFFELIRSGYPKDSWQVTEWLINYQGGFVRRGLAGELLLRFYYCWGIEPYYVILTVCFILYLGLVIFFYRAFRRAGLPLFLLPFVFFLGGPVLNDFWARKDVFLVWIFIGVVRLTGGGKWSIIGINLLLVIGVLVHESLAFWAIPVLLLLLYQAPAAGGAGRVHRVITAMLKLAPALVAFLLVSYYNGSLAVATAIWQSWGGVNFPFPSGAPNAAIPAAINGISWKLEKGLSVSSRQLFNFNEGVYGPFALVLILAAIFVVTVNIHKLDPRESEQEASDGEERSLLCSVMLLQFLAVIPLFILGIDYGRWVFFWITTSFILYLLVPAATLRAIFHPRCAGFSSSLIASTDAFGISRNELYLLTLFIGLSTSGWNMLSCCHTTPLYLFLEFCSNALKSLCYYTKYI